MEEKGIIGLKFKENRDFTMHTQSVCSACGQNTRVDLCDDNAPVDLFHNLKCHSFVVLSNHGLPIDTLNDIFLEWKKFFSTSEKYKYLRSDKYDEGYVPFNIEIAQDSDTPDFKEFFETHNLSWFPDIVNSKLTNDFLGQCVLLGEKIIQHVDFNLPEEVQGAMMHNLPSMISQSKNHLIRIMHYPKTSVDMLAERAAPHGDACLITILPAATTPGLEFLNKNGDWREPVLSESDVIVFNSDMLEICTNGYLKSAMHRVVKSCHNSDAPRYSMPFFLHPNRNAFLKKGLTAYEFLSARLTEIGYDGSQLINLDN